MSLKNFLVIPAWLTTAQPDRYEVCIPKRSYGVYIHLWAYLESDNLGRRFVTFSRPNNELDVPDPRLLSLHAACARVAHMSGAAEAFGKAERDLEDAMVLAFDGSSAHLLDHLLAPFEAIPRDA